MDLQESEEDVRNGCEDCLYALLELAALGLSALLHFVFKFVMVPIVIILSSFVICFPIVFERRDGPAREADLFVRHDSGYICLKKINLDVETRVGDAASFAAPGCQLRLTLAPRRGLGGWRRRLGGLGLLSGGRRLGDMRGSLLGWRRRGGLGGFPGSLTDLGD